MSEIREYKGIKYNIDDIKAYKQTLLKQKDDGLVLIVEGDFPQEVLEMCQVENERRKLEYADLDSQIANLDNLIETYSKGVLCL